MIIFRFGLLDVYLMEYVLLYTQIYVNIMFVNYSYSNFQKISKFCLQTYTSSKFMYFTSLMKKDHIRNLLLIKSFYESTQFVEFNL